MKYAFPVSPTMRAISNNDESIILQFPAGEIPFDRDAAKMFRNALDLWLEDTAPEAAADTETKVAVMLGDGDPPCIIFAISQASWDYMKDGKTHSIELKDLGVRVMLAGGPTRESIIEDVRMGIEATGGTFSRESDLASQGKPN